MNKRYNNLKVFCVRKEWPDMLKACDGQSISCDDVDYQNLPRFAVHLYGAVYFVEEEKILGFLNDNIVLINDETIIFDLDLGRELLFSGKCLEHPNGEVVFP